MTGAVCWFCSPRRTVRSGYVWITEKSIWCLNSTHTQWLESELLNQLDNACFYLKLDLIKGYWQILLTPLSQEKMAFSTPFDLHQFITHLLVLFGAPVMFHWLMDKILWLHATYIVTYLDDIMINSNNWTQHIKQFRAILGSLRHVELMANLKYATNPWAILSLKEKMILGKILLCFILDDI